MYSNNELVSFALKNIWCSPKQDQQYHFSLKKINNNNNGISGKIRVVERLVTLPDNDKYHVYVIGQINPNHLNLNMQQKDWFKDVWYNLKETINTRELYSLLYMNNGRTIPARYVKYMFIDEHTLVISIKAGIRYVEYTSIYLRLYSNSYFNTTRHVPGTIAIEYNGVSIVSMTELFDIRARINYLRSLNKGLVICFVNGDYISDIDMSLPLGVDVDYYYDSSIRSLERFKIGDLRYFNSLQDQSRKLLIYREVKPEYIQYYDDNEIFITGNEAPLHKGYFFYRHDLTAMSMVTDKDYSINYTYVDNLVTANSDQLSPTDTSDMYITLYVREAGLKRPLIYNDLRLHELYKLPYDRTLDTLISNYQSLNILRAEYLENSDYFKITEIENPSIITKDLTISALGYNAITKYYADNPVKVDLSKGRYVNIPYLYASRSTAFEHDSNGLLTGYYPTSGSTHICKDNDTSLVEFIQGTSTDIERTYGIDRINVDTFKSFNVYTKYISQGSVSDTWLDITDTQRYRIENDTVIANEPNMLLKVRYEDDFYLTDQTLSVVDGILYFPMYMRIEENGIVISKELDIPYGVMDVYLNGNRLIEGLSYFIDFPYINIFDKKHLSENGSQRVIIRGKGFPTRDLKFPIYGDDGFIYHGKLSDNGYYDIRDDRVMSLFIDGKLKNRNILEYSEGVNTVSVVDSHNGLPYLLKENFIDISSLTGVKTETLWNKSKELDKKIGDYISFIYPDNEYTEPSAITERYVIYSPFITKITMDLLDGNIHPDVYLNNYSDQDILLVVADYDHLLKMDPIYNQPDPRWVIIHPHPYSSAISVNLYMYRFLERVIRLYANGLVTLSGFYSIEF